MSDKDFHFHICCFSALDDVPRKQRGDPMTILSVLAVTGRFSCFEASESGAIAGSLVAIERNGWAKLTPKQYPWTIVELIDKGWQVLGLEPPAP